MYLAVIFEEWGLFIKLYLKLQDFIHYSSFFKKKACIKEFSVKTQLLKDFVIDLLSLNTEQNLLENFGLKLSTNSLFDSYLANST